MRIFWLSNWFKKPVIIMSERTIISSQILYVDSRRLLNLLIKLGHKSFFMINEQAVYDDYALLLRIRSIQDRLNAKL